MKDLGVWLDSELNFKYHIEKISLRANSILGLIKRCGSELNDAYTIKSLYQALVLPVIEYGSIIWMPLFQVHKNRI